MIDGKKMFLVVCSAVTASCSPDNNVNSVENGIEQRILDKKNLKNLLQNIAIDRESKVVQTSRPFIEIFFQDGRYERAWGPTRTFGRVTFRGSYFCVDGVDIAHLCRQIAVTNDGRYILLDQNAGNAEINITNVPGE